MRVNGTSWLRQRHLAVGLAGVVVFLGTGQYMDRVRGTRVDGAVVESQTWR